MNVVELLEREYGVKTTYRLNPETDTVALKPDITKVLSYNPRRIAFILVNLGTGIIHVSPQGDVSNEKGIYLVANGGTLTMVWTEDFEMPTFEWYAIADTIACKVYILEVLLQ